MQFIKYILFVILFVGITIATYAQCAMCKAVVENGGQEMAEGINSGITYLMAFPYILVALLAYVLFRYKKRIKS